VRLRGAEGPDAGDHADTRSAPVEATTRAANVDAFMPWSMTVTRYASSTANRRLVTAAPVAPQEGAGLFEGRHPRERVDRSTGDNEATGIAVDLAQPGLGDAGRICGRSYGQEKHLFLVEALAKET
jgi:hypothetical protein